MKNKGFFDWVAEMVMRIDYERFNTYRPSTGDTNIVICFDNHTGKVGVARCNPSDNFNLDIGKAIAYARCRGYEVPKQTTYKKLSEMKNGDIFKDMQGCRVMFIGKCKSYRGQVQYAVQWIATEGLHSVGDCDKEFEMVD